MKGGQCGLWPPRGIRKIALAACCALGLGWSWNVPDPVGPAESAQPDVEEATSLDASALARRILQFEESGVLADGLHPDRLEREIGNVLRLIRDRYPAMTEVTARPPISGILLTVEGSLRGDIASAWTESEAGSLIPVGHAAFDDLNAKLGLEAAEFWPASDIVILHFAELANPRAAVEAYLAVAGVADAELDRLLTDGPDIALSTRDGVWHVVMRNAWGDCPAGCIHDELHFFTVKDGHAERMVEEIALEIPEFRTLKLLAGSGW